MSDAVNPGRSVRAGRYDPNNPALPDNEPRRHAALSSAVGGMRVRAGRIPVELILLVGACILFPLGLVFIFLGWYGAAHTGRLYAQIDYLISGGLMGVGVSAAGGFMYFGYWLSRQLGESRRQNALTLQALRRLEDTLSGAAGRGPGNVPDWGAHENGDAPSTAGSSGERDASRSSTSSGDGAPAATSSSRRRSSRSSKATRSRGRGSADQPTGEVPLPMLVATARGSLLHLPGCPVVANKSSLKSVAAGSEGYGYCTMCDAAGALSSSGG